MGQDSKDQKVGRVGARELEELGTEDGMGDLGSGVGTVGVTKVRQSWDRRVGTRRWGQRIRTRGQKIVRGGGQRARTGELGPKNSEHRVGAGGALGVCGRWRHRVRI